MFTQMATMVKQHGELTARIEANIDRAHDDVAAAQDQIIQHWHRIKSNRGLIVKVFLVLALFIVFAVIFLVR